MSSGDTHNRELPQYSMVHVNLDIDQILQFLNTTDVKLTRLKEDIDRMHTDQQMRSLVVASARTAVDEDLIMDAAPIDHGRETIAPRGSIPEPPKHQLSHKGVEEEHRKQAGPGSLTPCKDKPSYNMLEPPNL